MNKRNRRTTFGDTARNVLCPFLRDIPPNSFASEALQIRRTIPHGVHNLEPRIALAEREDHFVGRGR
jgi:hypothetical protein